jgi:hypothetical protein
VAPKDVGRAARFGPVKTHPRRSQLRFVQVHRAIDTCLQAFGYRLLHLRGLGLVLL